MYRFFNDGKYSGKGRRKHNGRMRPKPNRLLLKKDDSRVNGIYSNYVVEMDRFVKAVDNMVIAFKDLADGLEDNRNPNRV